MIVQAKPTVSAVLLHQFVLYARQQGIDVARLKSARYHRISQAKGQVPWRQAYRLIFAVMRADPQHDIVYRFAGTLTLGRLDTVGFAVASAASLADVLERIARYSRVLIGGLDVGYVHDKHRVTVTVESSSLAHPIPAWLICTVIIFIQHVLQRLSHRVVPMYALNLAIPKRDADKIPQVFMPDDRYQLGMLYSSVSFDRRDVQQVNPSANEKLSAWFCEKADVLLSKTAQQDPFIALVDAAIRQQALHEPIDLKCIAHALDMSERTLQRRLRERGQTFSSVLSSIRCSKAQQLLRRTDEPIEEIAYLIGYAERSTFERAFKQWVGVAPYKYRMRIVR